jgi:hypothetical protein
MNVPQRYRLLIAILASLAVVVVVVVAVLVAGGGGPNASSSPSPSPSASTDPTSTPEGAVRAFFEAFAKGRRTDDPSPVEPFVTSKDSSAYKSVAAFLQGQKEVGKASVITSNVLSSFATKLSGQLATVTCTQVLGGYDIDVKTGQPRESPTVLPPTTFRVELKQINGRWQVDSFEAQQ